MHTTQGSPIDLDEDGLFFIESGCVVVQRDPDQSVALTLRSNRRRRLSVAPRMLRLKHRTFQLSRLGPVGSSLNQPPVSKPTTCLFKKNIKLTTLYKTIRNILNAPSS